MVAASGGLCASVIHDIGMPIYPNMWTYRPEWKNQIAAICETSQGDASTVYRFDLCSHTGTYVETSQHKLATDLLLSDFDLASTVRACKVVCVPAEPSKPISLDQVQAELLRGGIRVNSGDALIVATGWGMHHRRDTFIEQCPFFCQALVDWLGDQSLGLLGVDTPVIDNACEPFQAVQRLFDSTPQLLLMAPLVIDCAQVRTGEYFLSAAPLNVEAVSASLCRPLLLEGIA